MAGQKDKNGATVKPSGVQREQTIEELRDDVERTLDEAKQIVDTAAAEDRDLTDAEVERHHELLLRAEGLASRLNREKRRADRAAGAAAAVSGSSFSTPYSDVAQLFGGGGGTYSPSGKVARGARWGAAVVRACSDDTRRFKGITPSGSVLVDIPAPEAVEMGRPVAQLRSLVPSERSEGIFAFLRQTIRADAAAPVAPGALKPTSDYQFERVQDRVRTIAHLSTPLHRADLADYELLSGLISDVMHHGLEMALESQLINGTGVGEQILGLASTPGVQTVARVGVDDYGLLRTLRKGITQLESLGLAGDGYVMSPVTWEAVEASVIEDGSMAMNGGGQAVPVDRSARRLWGLPVISSPNCPIDVCWLADFAGSTKLWVREEARIDWSEQLYDGSLLGPGQGATLFETNQVRVRVEGRFGFGVTRPSGVVKISLV